ncbi:MULTISPECIES: hypothetical protein [unclassified Kitasatospora]|uniref:hypothetical protein n=1 Tax=unclassified Kitasatospora TaxID=2633591 RepID=UPI0012F85F23|nr:MULTISPECIES: hypothetical protein [unclassified Kitasatospora]
MEQRPPSFGDPAGPPTGAFGPPEAHRRSPVMVWGVVAAAVSAVAGVASAVAAFMGGSSQPSAAPTSSVVAPAPASADGSAAPATSATAKPAPAPAAGVAVRWTGKVVLGMEGIDLTQVPPTKGSSDTLSFLRPSARRTGSSGMEIKGPSALWTEAGEPTAQGCRNLLLTQSHDQVDVVAGDRVCVVDESSPIGLLKVTKTHYSQGSYGELDAELTIWDLHLKR